METTGNILSMLLIGAMSWQDFRTRSITAWLLPAIGLCFLLGEVSVLSMDQLLENAKVNYILLLLQFSVLWLWICFRSRTFVNIINTHIGLGDILLLFCLAPAFSPVNFILFYTVGAVIAMTFQVIVKLRKNQSENKIALAGMLGLPLLLMCAIRLIEPRLIVLTSDDWIYGLFQG